MSDLPDEHWLEEIDLTMPRRRAPSRLKSRVYSHLIRQMQAAGGLEGLKETRQAGHGLCVFEELVRITPLGQPAHGWHYCTVCHARVLGERVEGAPIYWGHCPYVLFQNR